MEDEFCHSDKERKSCKSLPKLQGQHFPFLGGFNFKKKKNASLFSLPCWMFTAFWAGRVSGRTTRWNASPWLHGISALMFLPSLRLLHLSEIQAEMVALAFLIKGAGEERGSSRKLKEDEAKNTDSQNSLSAERAQVGARRGRQRHSPLGKSIQAHIIGALSTGRCSCEVGTCRAWLSWTQLDTEAQHCEMFS